MNHNSGLLLRICMYILVLIASGDLICSAEYGMSIPGVAMSDLPDNLSSLQGRDFISFPPLSVDISDINNTIDIAENNNHSVSSLSFADTGMATMGNVVLVPVTPTPEGSGYYYFNTTGSDQSYYIYSPGTYSLQSGFSTNNSSAIRIGASDVVIDGNAQIISGNTRNIGINTGSGLINSTVRNFAGIKFFYAGVRSVSDHVSLINDSISDSYYIGVYSVGSDFSMDQSVMRNNTPYAIYVYGSNGTLTGNKIQDNPRYGLYSLSENITITKNLFDNNRDGIYSSFTDVKFSENTVSNNEYSGATIWGEGIFCSDNLFLQNEEHLHLSAENSTICNNTLSSSTIDGIFATGKNVTFADNTISNSTFGLFSMIDDCTFVHNRCYSNKWYGIINQGDNGTISENIIRNTIFYGIECDGNNSTIINNIVTDSKTGVLISDNYNTTVIGNQINGSRESDLYISNGFNGNGEGLIYNNYFGGQSNVDGVGNFSNYSYSWTNPSGPVRGTNVVGGPFIAGNYWSNASGTGWSDQQTPNVTGYTTKAYEIRSGVYDTAPLVPQKPVTINATANEWSNIVPAGNNSYRSYTNQTFITQPKPGADMPDVVVDSVSKGNVTSWTFTDLTGDHDIQAIGNPTPGQVHVFFTASQRYGENPLTVSFSSDQSLGSPTSWLWQFGDGITNTTQNPVHTYETPGTYTVSLRALNSQTGGYAVWNNCITVTDGVVPQPTQTPVPGKITPQFSAYPATGNAPLTVDFRDKSTGNPVTWDWDFGDGTYSSLQNPSHVYSTAGTYPVTLSVKNENYAGSLRIPGAVIVT